MSDVSILPGTGSGTGGGGGGGTSSGGGGGGSGSGSGGSGGGGGDPYLRSQRKAQRKAADRLLDDARQLNPQIRALRKVLNGGFRQALKIRLQNVMGDVRDQDKLVMEGYGKRVKSLEGSAEDNEKAAAGQGYLNSANRSRERANALSEATLQGAGESDMLRSQEMSLRNWNANQSEVNRGFFDTLRSVNTSLTDLNVDTKTARQNIVSEANADREQLWNSYFGQMSETYTQLGNVLGQQAEYYGLANEQVGSKGTKKKRKASEAGMEGAFMDASDWMSKAWKDPGIPTRLKKWDGRGQFGAGGMGDSTYREGAAIQNVNLARPEGATLRSWT